LIKGPGDIKHPQKLAAAFRPDDQPEKSMWMIILTLESVFSILKSGQ
jgi:hypothetical protein